MADPRTASDDKLPRIAILAGIVGFILTAGLIGFIALQALRGTSDARTPELTVQAGRIHPTPGGYLVEVEARNHSPRTAAAVEVEATLEMQGAQSVTSIISLDYVPGNSSKAGGIVLPTDPRAGVLTLRVTGYAEP